MMHFTPIQIIIGLMMAVVWGFICRDIAKLRGRDPRGWFFLGLFFQVFALLILWLVPSEKAMHAVALAQQEATINEAEIPSTEALPKNTTTLSDRKWYYLDSQGQQAGPLDLTELKAKRSNDEITNETFLWSEGMQDWKILDDLSYLKTELD